MRTETRQPPGDAGDVESEQEPRSSRTKTAAKDDLREIGPPSRDYLTEPDPVQFGIRNSHLIFK